MEYEQGDLPTFGNTSGNLMATTAIKYTSTTKYSTALTESVTDVFNYKTYTMNGGTVDGYYGSYTAGSTLSNKTTPMPTADADGDGKNDDIVWPAYYLITTQNAKSGKYSESKRLVYEMNGWTKPSGVVDVYAQNIYISADNSPAVWITAEDGIIAEDGTIAEENILRYTASNYVMRNFAYTPTISSDGQINIGTHDGKTVGGMGIGRVEGDEGTSSNWTSVCGNTKTILGTYNTAEEPVIDAETGEYVTGVEYDSETSTYTITTTTDPDDPDILYQTVITNYKPLLIDVVYIQYNNVTYKVSTDNVIAIDNGY